MHVHGDLIVVLGFPSSGATKDNHQSAWRHYKCESHRYHKEIGSSVVFDNHGAKHDRRYSPNIVKIAHRCIYLSLCECYQIANSDVYHGSNNVRDRDFDFFHRDEHDIHSDDFDPDSRSKHHLLPDGSIGKAFLQSVWQHQPSCEVFREFGLWRTRGSFCALVASDSPPRCGRHC